MSLEQNIMAKMKDAMKSKDQKALRGLRAIKSAILLAKTEKGGSDELSPTQEMKILTKLVKQRKDSIRIFEEQGRTDLASKEQEEVDIIAQFLPKQLSGEEIEVVLKKIIADTGASSMKDMGKVMGTANKQLAGKADGRAIADTVKRLLSV